MAMTTHHPLYAEMAPDWEIVRDCFKGERRIKSRGFRYLPATAGMIEDGALTANAKSDGWLAYNAYRTRARFPDFVKEAVKTILGAMHDKPPQIELPEAMVYMLKRGTLRGDSLEMLLKRINEEQILAGRCGLLGDVIDTGPREGQFYLSMYPAERIINWDEAMFGPGEVMSLNMVVLNESLPVRKNVFVWENAQQHRVLILGDPQDNEPEEGTAEYRVGVFKEDTTFNESTLITPNVSGKPSLQIPFVFVSPADVAPEPADPPLLGLANLCLGIYRGEADYRQSLFMQGQDTLVTIGTGDDENKKRRIGAGAGINIPNVDGDAKFIGVNSAGLPEQRQALENDYKRGDQMSGQLLDSTSRERESGDALRIRVMSRTTTLHDIAQAGAYGLQTVLQKLAMWLGVDPEGVIVKPNLDFANLRMTGQEVLEMVKAKKEGAPIAFESIHGLMAARGVTKKTFQEEQDVIVAEEDLPMVKLLREREKEMIELEKPPAPVARPAANGQAPAGGPPRDS
jgi:hypothetical protein